ncbi:MAG: hypothetical protein JWP89_3162 [Schlesneria sp.]|nr:hypothetical protein [Schlesneria sp.]
MLTIDRSFFEEYGLYKKFPAEISAWTIDQIQVPPIQRYCDQCVGDRTWREVNIRRTVNNEFRCKIPSEQDLRNSLVNFTFVCSSCTSETVQFILRFELKYEQGKLHNASISKVGQFPPFNIEVPPTLRDSLGTSYLPVFKKGLICESQGFGVGAFGYYRRIVELIIHKLIRDIRLILDDSELQRYDTALTKVEKTIVAQEKIALVKDMLPSVLRPGGNNPLGLLHDALSFGIHELDDEDCLALAAGIRGSLEMLSKHISLAKDEKGRIAEDMNVLRDNLNKIRGKISGNLE